MRKIKLSFFALPLFGLLISGCELPEEISKLINGNETSENGSENGSGQKEDNGAQNNELTGIDKVVKIVVDDLSSDNISYDMHMEASGENFTSITDETLEIAGNKYHVSYTSTDGKNTYSSDIYYETIDGKNYMYQKQGNDWVKQEIPYSVSFNYGSSQFGFVELLNAFKAKYTVTEDGYYYATDLELEVSAQALLETAASTGDYSAYTLTQETVTFSYEYLKIGIANEHISLFETKGSGITLETNEEQKTVTFVPIEGRSAVTKLHNFRNFGTTVITLPQVAQ